VLDFLIVRISNVTNLGKFAICIFDLVIKIVFDELRQTELIKIDGFILILFGALLVDLICLVLKPIIVMSL